MHTTPSKVKPTTDNDDSVTTPAVSCRLTVTRQGSPRPSRKEIKNLDPAVRLRRLTETEPLLCLLSQCILRQGVGGVGYGCKGVAEGEGWSLGIV